MLFEVNLDRSPLSNYAFPSVPKPLRCSDYVGPEFSSYTPILVLISLLAFRAALYPIAL